jgi:hypothetical protein
MTLAEHDVILANDPAYLEMIEEQDAVYSERTRLHCRRIFGGRDSMLTALGTWPTRAGLTRTLSRSCCPTLEGPI